MGHSGVDGDTAAVAPRSQFETLCGRIKGDGTQPSTFKSGLTFTWPAQLRGEHCDVAIDGWFVVGDRLILGRERPECDMVLAEIEEDLDAFLRHIDNGFFNIVVHDRRRRSTRLACDRFGGLPFYLFDEGATLTFASSHAGLRELIGTPLELDPIGMAELYWFGYQLGDRTDFRNTRRLPAGSVMEVFWDHTRRTLNAPALQTRSPLRFANPAAAADHLHETMRTVTASLYRQDACFGVKLSAGMDSRFIAATWPGAGLRSYTFGYPDSKEVKLAAQLAAEFGTRHRFVPLQDDFFTKLHVPIFPRHGIVEWFHQALVPAMESDGIQLVLDGLGGDVIVGGLTLKKSQSAWRQMLGLAPSTRHYSTESEAVAKFLIRAVKVSDDGYCPLTADARREVNAYWPEIEEDMVREVQRVAREGATLADTSAAVIFNNRTRRHISLQGTVCRPTVETLYPFLDRRFIELMGCFPDNWVASKRLYIELFSRHYAQTRHVPSTYSGRSFSASLATHLVGRVARYVQERMGMWISLRTNGRYNPWVSDGIQWRRWLLFDPGLLRGALSHLTSSHAFAPEEHDRAIHELSRRPAFSGTRFMYTASYLMHFRDT